MARRPTSALTATLLLASAHADDFGDFGLRTDGSLASAFSEGLKQQTLEKLRKDGESITIMVCGESGLGKTSLLSSLFHTELVWPSSGGPGQATTKIAEQMVTFDLEGMPFSARLIDTPGYGDTVNLYSEFALIVNRLDVGFRRMLAHERRIQRGSSRTAGPGCVDVALYFFAPHRCKKADIAFLKRMHGKVSIIPILAKADSMTADEVRATGTRRAPCHHLVTHSRQVCVWLLLMPNLSRVCVFARSLV